MKVWNRLKNAKTKVVMAMMFSVLVASLGFIGVHVPLAATQLSIYALETTTSEDIANTTSQMTTLFITLISVMIPLIIIMAYLGIFQDFISAMSRAFSGLFRRQ